MTAVPAASGAYFEPDSTYQQLACAGLTDAGHRGDLVGGRRAGRCSTGFSPMPTPTSRPDARPDVIEARREGLGRRGVAAGRALRDGRVREGRRPLRDHDVPAEIYRHREPQARGHASPDDIADRPRRGATSRSTRWRSRSTSRSSSTRTAGLADLSHAGSARRSRRRSFVRRRSAPDASRGAVRRDARASSPDPELRTAAIEQMRDRLEIMQRGTNPRRAVEVDARRRPVARSLAHRAHAASPTSSCRSSTQCELEQDPIHTHQGRFAHSIAVVAKTSPRLKLRLAALAARRGQARHPAATDRKV